MKKLLSLTIVLLAVCALISPVFASEVVEGATPAIVSAPAAPIDAVPAAQVEAIKGEIDYAIDNLFLFVAAILVLFMQAGFAMVESGCKSAKNTVNILFKNLMNLSVGVILFYVIGYGIMYGDSILGGFMGFGGIGIGMDGPDKVAGGVLHGQLDFFSERQKFCADCTVTVN